MTSELAFEEMTIAAAVAYAETTGLADRIRANDEAHENDRLMACFGLRLQVEHSRGQIEEFCGRLLRSEQTILALQEANDRLKALCDDLESRLVECQARIFVQVADAGSVEGVAI